MKRSVSIFIVLFLFLCGEAYAGKLNVVASIFPLGDIVKQIGGDRVDVEVMMPAGASPHTFEPTPHEMMEMQKAKVFVKVGAGLEFWAEKMIRASGAKGVITVDASSGLPLIRQVHSHESKGKFKEKVSADSADPHIWLDPVFVKDIADKIRDALTKADPEGHSYYKEKADRYKTELDLLHREISDKTRNFRKKEYVTFHPAWRYFSNRYRLKVAGVIEESPGREPSPKHIAGIVKEIKRINSKVVFAEPQFSPRIAEVIAKEAGARVLFLDPIGGANVKGRDTYLGLMRYNLKVMEEAMK